MRHPLCAALLVALSVTACLWRGDVPNLQGVDIRLTLLHTSDIHSRLAPFTATPSSSDVRLGLNAGNAPFGGGARLAYLVERERSRAQRALYLDAGDLLEGAPLFNQSLGETEVRFMSAVGVDAVTLGAHDLGSASAYAGAFARWGTFPILAANYLRRSPVAPASIGLMAQVTPYQLFNLDGLRVAVVGVGDPASAGDGGLDLLGVAVIEPNQALQEIVSLVHPQVDLVVVLSHLGLSADERLITGYGTAQGSVSGVRGIDVILGGGSHQVASPPELVSDIDGRDVLLVQSGAFAEYLGRLDVVLEDDPDMGGKRVVSSKYQVFPVDARLAPFDDASITALLAPYLARLERENDPSTVLGFAPEPLRRRSLGPGGDSALGNLVAESIRSWPTPASELAITDMSGLSADFEVGPVTLDSLYNVLPFESERLSVLLSGRELTELLDTATERAASQGCESPIAVAGLSFTMDCGQVARNYESTGTYADPAVDIRVNGAPLDPASLYPVAVSDELLGGADSLSVLTRNPTQSDSHVTVRTAVLEALRLSPRCGDLGTGSATQLGANASLPCLVATQDGRIGRRGGEGLDTLPSDLAEENP